jgi:hypothetical protein
MPREVIKTEYLQHIYSYFKILCLLAIINSSNNDIIRICDSKYLDVRLLQRAYDRHDTYCPAFEVLCLHVQRLYQLHVLCAPRKFSGLPI